MKRGITHLIHSIFLNWSLWIIFFIYFILYLAFKQGEVEGMRFLFRITIIYFASWILAADLNYRCLKRIDRGRKIEASVTIFKYLFLGLGCLLFIAGIFKLDFGRSEFYIVYFPALILVGIYFKLQHFCGVLIGYYYLYFNLKTLPIKELGKYEFKPEEGFIFYLKDGIRIKFRLKNLIMANKVRAELNSRPEVKEIKLEPPPRKFKEEEKLLYLGKKYNLKISEEKREEISVKFHQGKFKIKLPQCLKGRKRRLHIKEAVINWYKEKAGKKIRKRVKKYQEEVKIKPDEVIITSLEGQWGRCCKDKNELEFDWRLVMAPSLVIDYIVVRELARLKLPENSKNRWKLIEAIIPDYKKQQEWLLINKKRLTIN